MSVHYIVCPENVLILQPLCPFQQISDVIASPGTYNVVTATFPHICPTLCGVPERVAHTAHQTF